MRRLSPSTLLRLVAAVWAVPRIARVARAGGSAVGVVSPTAPADLSIVVPARDEADRIGALLTALDPSDDVIVVDDGSGDDTAAIARSHGATVVDAGEPPAGWAGKTWALHRGVEAATGSWIVHLDADVRPDAELPSAAVATAERLRADLLSVATDVVAPPSARWLHASLLATLVYRFGGPGALVCGRELANGQVLVARRSTLAGDHGWRAVAGHVTEDVALARHLAAHGRRVVMVDGGGAAIEFASFDDVRRGWGRSIGLPGVQVGWHSLLEVAALTVVMPLPLVRLVTRRGDLLDVALVAIRWGTAFGVARAYRPAGPAVWFSPLADPVAIVTVATSAFRRTVTWRGRRVPVPRVPPARSAARRRS